MKCQKCGKSEVNFHYSSSINGCVTEAHLCSECAAESGYDLESLFDTRSVFDDFFPFDLSRRFMPMPFFGLGLAPGYAVPKQLGPEPKECGCCGACEQDSQENPAAEVDEEMQKRREIGAIREQMRLAADKEDFEKAAELRDQIRRMEAGEG